MDKQAIEKELKSIFNLFKACMDKDYLLSMCEERGLLVNASLIKEAEDNYLSFEKVFKELVASKASKNLLLNTITSYNSNFHIVSKTVRPKSDPTQDAVQKKQEQEIKRILKENKKDLAKPLSKTLGKVWDRAFIIEMEKRYGNWDKSKKSFVNNEGQPLISISNLDSIQDYVYGAVSRSVRTMPRGWTSEDFAEGILAYMFYPSAVGSSKKDFYEYLDGYLENAKSEGKLPLEITGLLKKHISDKSSEFIAKHINKQFADETSLDSQIEYVKEIQTQLLKEKREDNRNKLQNKLEKAESRLRGLQEAVNRHKAPINEADPGAIQKHKFVEMDLSPSGEEIPFSSDNIDMVADIREAIEDTIIQNDLVESFTKYLKENADDKTFKVFKLVIENDDLSLSNKEEIRKLLEIADADDLEINSRNLVTISGKLKIHLAEYALKNDDVKMLESLEKMNLLPERFKVKKSFENIMSEEILSTIDFLEKSLKTPSPKVSSVIRYLEALSQKI